MSILDKEKIRAYVEYLLKHFTELQKDLQFLKYELEMFQDITEQEAIDVLMFQKLEGDGFNNTNVPTDKTGRVALGYREYVKRMNASGKKELQQQIFALEHELEYLKHCINKLSQRQQEIIQAIYMQGMSWSEAALEYNISRQGLAKLRTAAVERIVFYYIKERPGIEYEVCKYMLSETESS